MAIVTRAAVASGVGQPLVIDEVDLRSPGPGEVLVQMKASGLCHTDLSIIEGKFPVPLPAILGHEGAGIVLECGDGVTLAKAGDHVILNNLLHCGECRPCRSGRTSFCEAQLQPREPAFTWRGQSLRGGVSSFAAHTVVHEQQLSIIPTDMPFASASLVPCGVLTGTGAVWNDAQVDPGSSVIVFGLGSIGLNVIQAARLAGAARIIAADTNPAKEGPARQFGATDFVNPSGPVLLEEQVERLLGGKLDYAFECVGNPALLARATAMVSPYHGVCMAVGIAGHDQTITLPASTFYFGRTVRGTFIGDGNPREQTPKIIEHYCAGDLKIDELVTHRLPFEQINEGFELMRAGEAIRTVILF
jgi:S-(hydroxymethyl)glutathione dehydrogenase/alcohol dehydrogenase